MAGFSWPVPCMASVLLFLCIASVRCQNDGAPAPAPAPAPGAVETAGAEPGGTSPTERSVPPQDSGGSKPPIREIIGGVAGAVLLLAILAVLSWRKRRSDAPTPVNVGASKDSIEPVPGSGVPGGAWARVTSATSGSTSDHVDQSISAMASAPGTPGHGPNASLGLNLGSGSSLNSGSAARSMGSAAHPQPMMLPATGARTSNWTHQYPVGPNAGWQQGASPVPAPVGPHGGVAGAQWTVQGIPAGPWQGPGGTQWETSGAPMYPGGQMHGSLQGLQQQQQVAHGQWLARDGMPQQQQQAMAPAWSVSAQCSWKGGSDQTVKAQAAPPLKILPMAQAVGMPPQQSLARTRSASNATSASDQHAYITDQHAFSSGAIPPGASTLQIGHVDTTSHHLTSATDATVERASLIEALNELRDQRQLLFGQYHVLSSFERRGGGQGCVQFVRNALTQTVYAVKFFFNIAAFVRESTLYVDPELRPLMAATHKVCDNRDGEHTTPSGYRFPPFIVIEKGEPLDEWITRMQRRAGNGEIALISVFQALLNLAERLQSLHKAGYVHCDLKPSNVLWLAEQHAWTLIDFGSAFRVGTAGQLSFTLAYAPPEIILAYENQQHKYRVDPSADVWALGLIAFEMLTGERVFPPFTPMDEIMDRISGRKAMPWEDADSKRMTRKLRVFKETVLDCLRRDPSERPQISNVVRGWEHLLSATTGGTNTLDIPTGGARLMMQPQLQAPPGGTVQPQIQEAQGGTEGNALQV